MERQILDLMTQQPISILLSKQAGEQDAVSTAMIQMLIDLLQQLERRLPFGPYTSESPMFVHRFTELTLLFPGSLFLTVDYFDRQPFVNGIPKLHYRIEKRGLEGGIWSEFRPTLLDDAVEWMIAQFIRGKD